MKKKDKETEIFSFGYGFFNGAMIGLSLGLFFQKYLLSQLLLVFGLFILAMVFFKTLPDKD